MRSALVSLGHASLLAVLWLGTGACGAALPSYDYSKEPDPTKLEYVLGVSDSVDINVWKYAELNTKATIRPDGTITMPLIGDLQAEGKTPSELKAAIATKLAEFYKESLEITVAVTNWASYRFTVSGEVNTPGVLESTRYVTVAEAIALAGGLTRFARKNGMILTRTDPKTGAVRRIPLAYDPIISGERPDMNIYLMRGDRLHVP